MEQQYLLSYLGDAVSKIEPTDVKNIFWVELQDSTTIDEITKKISSIKDVEIIKGITLKQPFESLGVDADEGKRRGKTTIKVKSNIVNLEGGGSMAEEGVELSPKERGRLDELQKKEDIDNLNELENKEYEILVNKYRKTKEYKHYKKSYGDSMATGSGHIKNQYEGKSAEEVWNAWTHSQRLHFLTDHETELEQEKALLGIRQEIIFRTFYDQPYQELHEIIKETLHYHIFAGQYAGGGSMEKGGATDILYIESWYNDGKTQMLGSDGTGILRGKPTDRGIENAMDRQAKLLKSLIGIKPFLKDGNVVIKAVDRTGKVIKTKTINLEQLSSGGSMARGGKSDIVPYVVYGKRLKQTPSGFESVWETIHHLDRKPSKGDAEKHRNEFNESLKKGGANEHLGTNYRVTDAKIINQKTGEEIDFYKAPTFETFSEGAALSDKFGAKPNPIVPIWQGGLYYLKLDNLIRDNYNKTMKIKGYFKDGIRVIENTDFPLANQQLIDIPFNILAEFIDSGRFKIANVVYETERDKKLLQNEINYIVDAHKVATTEAEKARLAREVATTEAEKARLAREVATTEAEKARLEGDYTKRIMDIRDSFKKTAKEYSDTIAGMEAMAGGVKAEEGEIYKPEKKGTIFRGNELIKYYQKVNGNYRLNFYRMDETKSKIPVHCDKFGDCLFADTMDVQPADLYAYIKEGKFLAKGGSMAEGGKRLPTKYIRIEKKSHNMSPEEVWESWSVDQRYHFLLDHESQLNELGLTNKDEIFNSKNNSYSGLSEEISSILNNHVKEGVRYAIGGSMAGGGVGSYEEWKAVDAPHPLSYRAYKLKEGHFKITHVDESGEYQLGYTSSPIDFIKETAKPYKIKKLSSGGSMAIGGRLSDSERFKSYASAKFSELKTALANKKITEDQFDKKTTALGHEIETKFHELLMKQGKTEEEAIRMASKQRNDFFTEQYSFTKGGKAQPTNQYIWGHGEILDSYPSDIGGSSASVEHIIEFEGKKYIINTNQDEDKVLYANKPAILSENSDNSAAKGVKINGSSPIKKINKKDKFWHARIISPKGAKTCAVPEWAETIASTVHEGAKVTTCIMGDKEWHVQRVMVPVKGINKSKAKSIAEQIVAKIIKN